MRYVCLVVVLAIVAGCSKPAPKKIVAKPKPAVEAEADPREAPVPGSSEEMIARANRVDAAAIAAKDSDVTTFAKALANFSVTDDFKNMTSEERKEFFEACQTYALNSNNVEVARHLVIFGCRAPMFSIIKAVKANRAEVIRMLMEQNYNLDFSEYRNPDFDLVGVAEKAGHNELAEELRQYLSTGRAPGASPRSAPGS